MIVTVPGTTGVRRVAAGGAGWVGECVSALDVDGAVVLTGTGLDAAAAETGAEMLGVLDLLLPYEPELTVYARGHLRQYPPTGPGSRVLDVLGSTALLQPARAVLGADCYVANYMGHTVLTGSAPQPVHADWGPLWTSTRDYHPPFLLAYNLALLPTDAANGAIEAWPGTHRLSDGFAPGALTVRPDALAARRVGRAPVPVPMEAGDLLLRDVRTWHRGTNNSSAAPRPIVFGLVSAGWYRYDTTRPLLLSGALAPAVADLGVEVLCEFTDAELDPVALSVGSPED